jgi:hypothetical protein
MLVDNILSQPAYCAMVPQKSFAGTHEFFAQLNLPCKGVLAALAQLLQSGTPDVLHHSSELLQAVFVYPYDWTPAAFNSVQPSLLATLTSELYSRLAASILTLPTCRPDGKPFLHVLSALNHVLRQLGVNYSQEVCLTRFWATHLRQARLWCSQLGEALALRLGHTRDSAIRRQLVLFFRAQIRLYGSELDSQVGPLPAADALYEALLSSLPALRAQPARPPGSAPLSSTPSCTYAFEEGLGEVRVLDDDLSSLLDLLADVLVLQDPLPEKTEEPQIAKRRKFNAQSPFELLLYKLSSSSDGSDSFILLRWLQLLTVLCYKHPQFFGAVRGMAFRIDAYLSRPFSVHLLMQALIPVLQAGSSVAAAASAGRVDTELWAMRACSGLAGLCRCMPAVWGLF